jgi:hypothetical protein
MVLALIAAGLPSPDPMTGDIADALWKAGFFRLRGVLVGTVAYQSYSGILGKKLAQRSLMTQDLDAGQFYSISQAIGDSMPPILDVLRSVDETFLPLPDLSDPQRVWRFRNQNRYLVEFLTPDRGAPEYADWPAEMPALGGVSARPLRHLDYLIYSPIRSVMLHKAGVPITIPAPWRYAVHKLIIEGERPNLEKSNKDILQAEQIIVACIEGRRAYELQEAFREARSRGPRWQEKLERGIGKLAAEVRNNLEEITKDTRRKGRKKS